MQRRRDVVSFELFWLGATMAGSSSAFLFLRGFC